MSSAQSSTSYSGSLDNNSRESNSAANASILSSLIGAGVAYREQNQYAKSVKTQNALNAEAQDKALAQQLYMSDTAHTREVQDLKNAGLNPILTAMGGQGATTAAVGGGGFSAISPGSMASKVAAAAQTAATVASVGKLAADSKMAKANAKYADVIAQSNSRAASAVADKAVNDARVSQVDADITDSPYGRGLEYAKRTMGVITPLISAVVGGSMAGRGLNALLGAGKGKEVPSVRFGAKKTPTFRKDAYGKYRLED